MKKLILSVGLALVSFAASAQNYKTFSFLAVNSLSVSNTIGATNLYPVYNTVDTNFVGMVYTNGANERIVVTGTGATNNIENLFKDVNIWTDRNGSFFQPVYTTTTLVDTTATNQTLNQVLNSTPANLTVKLFGGSGANVATTIIFVPIIDDQGNESTDAAQRFTWSVTPVTTSIVSLHTNAPFHKWIGCRGVRVKSITAGDTDASSNVWIQELNLSGFVP